ncbi:aromatic amino acid transaminase [Rhodopila sp.]|uniref:amino acid aminotransferase n=1 Tax=Rhodopila sp. TaxID=2480087 RepID=UPI003D128B60
MFQHVEPYAGDPILTLNETFQADPRPHKVNLSIGIYLDQDGRVPALDAVHQAEQQMAATKTARPYLPMEGSSAFRRAVQDLLFGATHPAVTGNRVATIQTIGSNGALKIGAEFLHRWFPASSIWVSDPTWDNHRAVFEGASVPVETYPYYDPDNGGVRFDAMRRTLGALPAQGIVLLHACCHNPTGADLTQAQWTELAPILRDRALIPFLDLAYQGFADGIEADAFAVRLLADLGLGFVVTNSFSKSMSLYGERAGALSIVCGVNEEADRVLGQMKSTVRQNYSSPPVHAGQIVTRLLTDPVLRTAWEHDLGQMRDRMTAMRIALHAALTRRVQHADFGYLLRQRGMFSYTGLTARQVDHLREEHAIYLLRSGRLCITGLNDTNIEAVAEAIAAVTRTA